MIELIRDLGVPVCISTEDTCLSFVSLIVNLSSKGHSQIRWQQREIASAYEVSVVSTGYGLGDRIMRVRFLAEEKNVFFSTACRPPLGPHQASYKFDTGGFSPWGGGVKLIIICIYWRGEEWSSRSFTLSYIFMV
jgi:hypothetical protein